jgi:hypothetical protein
MSVERNIGRKGMWTQVFLILFFVLLVILAIALLTIDRSSDKPHRPTLVQDLRDQQAGATLIALLRTPVTFTAQGTSMSAPLADIIVLNTFAHGGDARPYDEVIRNSLLSSMPKDALFDMTIRYPDGRSVRYYHKGNGILIAGYVKQALLPGNKGNVGIEFSLLKFADQEHEKPTFMVENG